MKMNKYVTDYLTAENIQSLGVQIQGIAGSFLQSNAVQMSLYIQNNYSQLISYNIDSPVDYIKQQISFEINKIASTLMSEYDPLENVSLTITKANDGEDVHTYGGEDVTTRTGASQDTWSSSQTQTYNNISRDNESISNNSGTSFDDLTYSPINKNETSGDSTMTGSMTIAGSGNNSTSYNNLRDVTEMGHSLTMSFGREETETKRGINGLFPYQRLIEFEYYLRTKTNFFQTCVKLIVNSVSSGVYDCGD